MIAATDAVPNTVSPMSRPIKGPVPSSRPIIAPAPIERPDKLTISWTASLVKLRTSLLAIRKTQLNMNRLKRYQFPISSPT